MRYVPAQNTDKWGIADNKPTLKNVHNILSRLKEKRNDRTDAERSQDVLEDMCNNEAGSVASMYVGADDLVETIAFQSRKMRRLFAAFPDVVMVDSTFGTNRNQRKLFSFVVVDVRGNVGLLSMLLVNSQC